ncbi:MAG TPA: proteasome activator [Acidimicrobiia bacterium]
MDDKVKPEVVATDVDPDEEESPVSEPTKLIRIASMTRAMLEEVRQAPLDDVGRARLAEVHARSLAELRGVLSADLLEEFDEIMIPLQGDHASEAELRIAQAQLIGWLEGLFHGIQASLWSQQMAAQHQLAEMQRKSLTAPSPEEEGRSGLYL